MDIKNNGSMFYIGEENKPDAYILYEITNEIISINSTVVNPELRGRGLAGVITKFVLDFAKEKDLKVNPICSYTVKYFEKHSEYANIRY